jgi:hypothetical protein
MVKNIDRNMFADKFIREHEKIKGYKYPTVLSKEIALRKADYWIQKTNESLEESVNAWIRNKEVPNFSFVDADGNKLSLEFILINTGCKNYHLAFRIMTAFIDEGYNVALRLMMLANHKFPKTTKAYKSEKNHKE